MPLVMRVLCGGVFGSAQVLMLSGIGPADELRKHAIAVAVELRLRHHPHGTEHPAAVAPCASLRPDPGAAPLIDPAFFSEPAFLRRTTHSAAHPVGTCRIGPDAASAVVDPQLRVHGVAGLRIADASVMPSLIGADTDAAVLAIAERAAELLLG
ncbi:hypothetical protein Pth03_76200 [Planotetraspora thailandica]|uniref:Glucose-methanol-choline oxidoreductase C-terminal domain-containing protein n=1 Tax=Planotetraspora thailandica TaxID=487172 RepID=A0A8J3Y1V9_9ACTN|nr:hypothetical protein Pth03_76200 [Planotetraspora thailandica]